VLSDVGGRSLKGKMRAAERSGALAVGLIGDDEIKAQRVTLRRLSTGEQLSLRVDEVSAQLREWEY
jgi:histidyl-tRNA synthetase